MATVTSATSGDLRTSNTDPRVARGATVGELLRRTRENRGLTLERIARETRIPQRHLEALEHADLTASSAGFYERAEIRAYARAVGLDQEVLRVALLPFDTPRTSREIAKATATGATRTRAYALVALAVVALTLAAFGRAILQPVAQPSAADVGGSTSSPAQPVMPVDESTDGAPTQSPAGAPVGAQETTEVQTPAPPTSVTELVVTTDPAGARVTVNGIGWGVTPLTIRHMPPGEKRIRVSKEGLASEERVLRIEQGRQHVLDIQLNGQP